MTSPENKVTNNTNFEKSFFLRGFTGAISSKSGTSESEGESMSKLAGPFLRPEDGIFCTKIGIEGREV
jgi:hypothetical protein